MIDLDTLIREADPARDLAVPEVNPAEIRRLSGRPPRSRRKLIDAAVGGAAVAVALGVALIVLLAGGQNRASLKTSGNSTIPAASRPLTRMLAVLRRPETPADRAVESVLRGQNVELSLVRLAAVTPWGEQVVLAPEQGHPYDTLGIYVISSSGFGGSRATANQIEAGHAWTGEGPGGGPSGRWRGIRLIVVVPDGVAKVAFWLEPERHVRLRVRLDCLRTAAFINGDGPGSQQHRVRPGEAVLLWRVAGHAVVRAGRPADEGDRQSHRRCREAICRWWPCDQPAARRGHGRPAPRARQARLSR